MARGVVMRVEKDPALKALAPAKNTKPQQNPPGSVKEKPPEDGQSWWLLDSNQRGITHPVYSRALRPLRQTIKKRDILVEQGSRSSVVLK